MILTGEHMTAQEAFDAGLVSKLFAPEETLPSAIAYAQAIAEFSAPVVAMAKEAVNTGAWDSRCTPMHQTDNVYEYSRGSRVEDGLAVRV